MKVSPTGHDGRPASALWLAAALLVPLPAAAGELYRWVDDEGDVHYSDAPPADATRGKHATVREDGTTKEEIDPAAERAAAAATDDSTRRKAESEAARRDRVLLRTYSNVDEIERTRARHLEALDGEIGLAEHRVRRIERKVDQYERLLEELPEDNEHRAEMKRQRRDARERLERRRGRLDRLEARRERAEQRFADDIERFRELQSAEGP